MSSRDREGRRQARRRTFQPSLDGLSLESRLLLSTVKQLAAAKVKIINPPRTAAAGGAVILTTPSAQQFYVNVAGSGTVRAVRTGGGAYRLIVQGTDVNSELTINPLLRSRTSGIAHTFSPGNTTRNGLIKISGINVVSGRIGAILGYRTAQLTGPVVVGDSTPIDRIAFYSVEAGGSIATGGDLNTFDVFANASFNTPTGLFVGRDLNFMNVGGTLGLNNGANMVVGRDIGLVGQPVKGTETGIGITNNTTSTTVLRGGIIQGNMVIGSASKFVVGRSIDADFTVRGTVFGVTQSDTSRLAVPQGANNFLTLGGAQPYNGL